MQEVLHRTLHRCEAAGFRGVDQLAREPSLLIEHPGEQLRDDPQANRQAGEAEIEATRPHQLRHSAKLRFANELSERLAVEPQDFAILQIVIAPPTVIRADTLSIRLSES